jgi:Tol biopolymer transport system component
MHSWLPGVALTDPITGRRVRRLTAPPRNNLHTYYDVSPWSPDWSRIVYASNAPAEPGAEIWVMDAGGGNPRRVASHPTFHLHTASWQQWVDNRTIVLPLSKDGRPGMRLIDVDTLAEQWVQLPGRIDKLSPDGRRGVVIDPSGEAGLVDMRTHAYAPIGTLEQVREQSPQLKRLGNVRTYIGNPRWSPDGRYVLFRHGSSEPAPVPGTVGNASPAVGELFVYDTTAHRFAYAAPVGHHPGWHPNGEDMLYVWHNAGTGRQELRLVRHDGTNERVLFDAEHVPAGHPSFHPTRHHLLVTDAYGGRFGYGIVLVDLRRQRLELLATMPFGEDPATAPQARANDPPNHGSWSYPRWTTNSHPCWNRDGSAVLYADMATGTAQLHLVDTADLAA